MFVLVFALFFYLCLSPATTVDCTIGSTMQLGEFEEGFTGNIEILSRVEQELEISLCPQCAPFLEFVYNSSMENATVRTKKPLDTEALREAGGVLSYQITCTADGVENIRTLIVKDVNDNAPVFEKEEYTAYVPETLPVGEVVIQVKAVDADFSPANNRITYTIQQRANLFAVNPLGEILLKGYLNYTMANKHNFTVKAQDGGGLFSETIVVIRVLTPQFDYDPYEASIPENQEVHRKDVVIPLNQEIEVVKNKSLEMKHDLDDEEKVLDIQQNGETQYILILEISLPVGIGLPVLALIIWLIKRFCCPC
ncbi:protocadherin beta-9-like isoform X2 [Sardina pilchardus]|uniref:protocadherin beta-9-like isoform X2 n=1 Tax=Sardina pilchardus TaxID=27697 RepID=UPI002E0F281D